MLGKELLSAVFGKEKFVGGEPHKVVDSSGGACYVWGQVFSQIQDAQLGAAKLVIEPSSLALPQFSDSAELSFIEKGSVWAGLISPFGIPTKVKQVKRGDFWAIPRGWTQYTWNDSENEACEIFSVAETSGGAKKEQYTPSFLMGGKKGNKASILHGFSKELLAHAWHVSPDDVDHVVNSQKEAGFVKVTPEQSKAFLEEVQKGEYGEFPELVFNIFEAEPEVCVKDGGVMSLLHAFKLPVLRQLGLAAAHFCLKPGAMEAPQYTNGPRVIYIIKGKGRVEMASPDGQPAMRMELKAGELFVVPSFYVVAQWANSDEPFEWIGIASGLHPTPTYLAGSNSIYKMLPLHVVAAGLNIDVAKEQEIRSKRCTMQEMAILPPGEATKEGEGNAGTLEKYIKQLQSDLLTKTDLSMT